MTEPNDQYEFAGYEDVIALIEGLAIRPTASVQAEHVASAARAVSKLGVRSFRSQPRPRRGATVTVFRRGTAVLVAAIVSVSGLAVAGVLPEDVQNAVSGTALLLGVNLPTPQSSSISRSSTEPDTGAGIGDEQPTRPAGLVSPPSQPASSDDECVADETEESPWSDSEEDADETQAPCSEVSEEGNEDDESDETPDSDDEEDDENDERDDDGVGHSNDAEEEADSDD